ncbi:DNA methyltransferase [Flavobacterium phage vB_FspS_tooticki9-1]|uniref:DNA methyltransferase n=13 Tax=Caudoviricetes TaxID=2731619 RepID=A0A6B9LV78_9CAUD|nr:DNA methyltransferase [Flavobacterium phage vB_FspS_filifjonk9-1]YP_009855014.1 DNA methyltransferase [Flavobacterium phage vB_FspS_mumin9-1]YP_009855082.1 DNA methyltransferase [Flavobacterium phage vB_FspS_mymlan6-1]YP_009855497.1 DNA methyltransferase [Flavobacterium phage vB_FspS_tooticki6-1]QHB39620.1 DNA methyltransferase [Flavobacterium phage vB_FspS_mumin6-1]QHB39687.1 DNA methyltransferase [Flavobacterium phage vB_FspS_mumin6-2]QHB39753.1 DNA methyltransferase [Flavobacterium phag
MQKSLFENEMLNIVQKPTLHKTDVSRSTFFQGDCLVEMDKIEDKSIDMILCDLPYNTTEAVWDLIIPFELLWKQYERVIKDNGSIVLTAQQPFTSAVVMSNTKLFKHTFIWEKDKCANFLAGSYQPLKIHEEILVFSKGGFTHNAKIKATYNSQLTDRKPRVQDTSIKERSAGMNALLPRPNPTKLKSSDNFMADKNLAKSVIYFATEHKDRLHPTQKPIALMEYLIKTYTNEGETVLDNCMGSGTTGVACKKTGRHFIGIEKDENYYNVAVRRVSEYCG